MPGLGNFLKKKRARDGPPDQSASLKNPSTASTSSRHQQQPSRSLPPGAAAAPAAPGVPPSGGAAAAPAPSAQSTQQSNPHEPHPFQQPAAQSTIPSSSGAGTKTVGTASAPRDPASPTVPAQVVNAPQNAGAATASSPNSSNNFNASPFNASATSIGAAMHPMASASPGTDPALLQQQQEAAMPPPPQQGAAGTTAMQTDHPVQAQQPQQQQTPQYSYQNPVSQPQYQQYQKQPMVQQQQYQPQQSQQQQPGHQQQASTSSTARVTTGKYTLTDFDILRTLGTGSFGRVHLVQSKHNHRFYAIKVLKKAQVVKMKQVEHTNDERRMLSDVKHPFLITLWGTFQDWKNLYMVMDFVEGGELFSLLRKSGRFPNPVAKFYAAEVTLALEYLHSKNIIYRDLKPENLLLDRHGHLKITDFGFAKRVPDKTWTLCGTPDYLAPEVVSNKGYNKSVDWWSLGILIYEMLCGYTPFWDSGSPMRIYENILKAKIKYPSYIVPEAQDLLQKLITADLTKRLGNLYGGPADVKSHPWFHEVTWDRLARKDIDAPYTPPVKAGAGDASQFDKYPEEHDKYGEPGGDDVYGHLFTGF